MIRPLSGPTHEVAAEVSAALAQIDLHPWRGRRVAIVLPDPTRPLPIAEVLDAILSPLRDAGARSTVVIATGLHRSPNNAELRPYLESAARHSAAVEVHDARADTSVPVTATAAINRTVFEAFGVVSVGWVEPHQYAGFSGGAKTIAVGCAGASTIHRTHGLELFLDPGTRLLDIDNNPFQSRLRATLGRDDVVGIQITADGAVFAGPLLDAFESAVAHARPRVIESVTERLDWMHLPVATAKAQSFYQASRAASYVALVPQPVIKQGGLLVVEAACPEGIGAGSGERACADLLRRGRPFLDDVLLGRCEHVLQGGAQRALVIAQTLSRARIAVVGAMEIPELAAVGIEQFPDLETLRATGALSGCGRTFADVFSRIPTCP